MLLAPNGIPVIFATESTDDRHLHRDALPPANNTNTPGNADQGRRFSAAATGHADRRHRRGRRVTGAAMSPDGTRS